MNTTLTAIAASIILSFSAGAYAQGAPAPSGSSGSSGQQSQKQGIDQQHKAAMEKCNGMKGNARDICKAEADGQKTVAEAQAKVAERDSPKNRLDLEKAKAESQYKVAKAQCGDQVGDAKKACEKEAKAAQDLAIAQAEKQSLTQSSGGGGTSGSTSAGQPASSGGSASGGSSSAPPASPGATTSGGSSSSAPPSPSPSGAGGSSGDTSGSSSTGQTTAPAPEQPKAQ